MQVLIFSHSSIAVVAALAALLHHSLQLTRRSFLIPQYADAIHVVAVGFATGLKRGVLASACAEDR